MATVLYTRKFLVLLSTFGLFYTLHPAVGVRFRFSDVPGYNPPAYNPPAYTGGSDAYLPSAPEKSSLVNEAPRKKRKGWKTAAKVAGGLGGAAALGGVGYGLYRMLRQKTPGQVTPDNGMPRPVLPLIPPVRSLFTEHVEILCAFAEQFGPLAAVTPHAYKDASSSRPGKRDITDSYWRCGGGCCCNSRRGLHGLSQEAKKGTACEPRVLTRSLARRTSPIELFSRCARRPATQTKAVF